MRAIAIALFQQERIFLGCASKIANLELMACQKLLGDRGGLAFSPLWLVI